MKTEVKICGSMIAFILISAVMLLTWYYPEYESIKLTLYIFAIVLAMKLTYWNNGRFFERSVPYAVMLTALVLVGSVNALYASWDVRLQDAVAVASLALGGRWLWQLARDGLDLIRERERTADRE